MLFSSLAILNVIFTYGMDVAFLRYFVLEQEKEKKQSIFSTVYWTILGTGLCFGLFMILKPNLLSIIIFKNPQYVTLIRLAAGILLADALNLITFLILRGVCELLALFFVWMPILSPCPSSIVQRTFLPDLGRVK